MYEEEDKCMYEEEDTCVYELRRKHLDIFCLQS